MLTEIVLSYIYTFGERVFFTAQERRTNVEYTAFRPISLREIIWV